MKKILNIISAVIVCCVFFASCNDDFLEKNRKDALSEDSYFTSEGDLQLYLNYFYRFYIRGFDSGFGGPTGGASHFYPRNSYQYYLFAGDLWTDNMVITNNGIIDSRYNGTYRVPTATSNTGWDFTQIYHLNYFLQRYHKAPLSTTQLNRYKAEALFFKAWDYYEKVLFFGDFPWLSKDLQTDSPELYMARTPRAAVMDSVLACINFAVRWLPETTQATPTGRINKDHALALKSRICLFEGTFRKYHTQLGLASTADKYLKEAADASNELIRSNKYQLYTSTDGTPYWNLFKFRGTTIPHKEAIIARVYVSAQSVGSYAQRYINNPDGVLPLSATRSLVDEYLCVDGKPIYISGTEGNYVSNPLFKGYDMWSELDNRDPRLRQTIAKPGELNTIYNHNDATIDINKNGILYPEVAYNSRYGSSGYKLAKHWMATNLLDDGNSDQIGMEIRYAEILLNYIEALCAMNESNVTDAILDLTINALRERAGFDFTQYPNSRLQLGNIPDDPRLDDIYNNKLDYTVSPLMREIRRERRVELAIEALRYFDLMRWKAGPLLTVPLRGMKFTSVEHIYQGTPPRINADGITENFIVATKGKDVYVDNEGFIVLYPMDTNIPNGTMKWEDFRYYWPIPRGQITLNENLIQTPGWEKYY